MTELSTTIERALNAAAEAAVAADEAAASIEQGLWASAAVRLAEAGQAVRTALLELACTQDAGEPDWFLAAARKRVWSEGSPLA